MVDSRQFLWASARAVDISRVDSLYSTAADFV